MVYYRDRGGVIIEEKWDFWGSLQVENEEGDEGKKRGKKGLLYREIGVFWASCKKGVFCVYCGYFMFSVMFFAIV
jgi:hypothetical protein